MDLHHVDIQFSVRGGRAGLAGGMKKKKESSTQSLMDLAYKDKDNRYRRPPTVEIGNREI